MRPLDNLRSLSDDSGVGELEPPLEMLELLLAEDDVEASAPHYLNGDPLTCLLAYELEVAKDPPPKPKKESHAKKSKKNVPPRDYAAERAKRKAKLAALAEAEANAPPSEKVEPDLQEPVFRARTRGEQARHSAFVAEATSTGSDTMPTREKLRRDSITSPVDPPLIDTVDKQQSFALFDAGWILPHDSKRGGRSVVDKRDVPPPKKRQRTGNSSQPFYASQLIVNFLH